jgi:ATP-binding protein involved in chromosome partitioning
MAQYTPSKMEAIPGVKKILAVSSGKGGVGKSTVSVNLATALALQGKKVGLMDSDVYGPNIPTMMGVTEQPMIQELVDSEGKKKEMFIPPLAHGVKVMSMGMLVEQDQPLIWRGPMLHSIVNQFCHQVSWGELDVLVVDMPPGTGDVQLSLSQIVPVDAALLVSTPQEISMQDVRKAYHMFQTVKVPVMGIVENMSYFEVENQRHYIFGKEGGQILAQKLKTKLLAQLPLVQKVRECGDWGTPVVIKDPSSEVSQKFNALAEQVMDIFKAMEAEGIDPRKIVQIQKF